MSGATYAGKSYEMDLDYAIQDLRNRYIRENKKSGLTTYKIEKLTKNETKLLNNALSEYKLEKDDVLKEINNSRERDIHCIGMRCGKFEKIINNEIEVKK